MCRPEEEVPEMKEQEEVVTSTVRPEEIPPIPENRFLMRRSPQFQQSREDENDLQTKEDRQRERFVLTNLLNEDIVSRHNDSKWSSCSSRSMYNSQSGYQRRLIITRSGRKIKGRGQRVGPSPVLQDFTLSQQLHWCFLYFPSTQWYRTPSRSRSRSRDRFRRSETPPRWRQEIRRQRMRAVTGERWIKGDR